jgi:hypothetical protein
MPKFIDHHPMAPGLPPEAAEGIAARIKSGERDQFGCKGINVFLAKDGTAFCLSEAPSAEAVVKAHEAAGFPIGRDAVVEVDSVV